MINKVEFKDINLCQNESNADKISFILVENKVSLLNWAEINLRN